MYGFTAKSSVPMFDYTMSLINKIFQNLLDKNAFRLFQALFLLAHYYFHYLH